MERLGLISRKPFRIGIWLLLAFFVYVMGTVSILNPATRTEALRMTPVALLLTTAVLLFFSGAAYTWRMAAVLSAIAVIGFLAELAGVQTGWIFGQYQYTSHFGPRWWGTPPLIGLNWMFLSYAWAAVVHNAYPASAWRILYAALGMLAYDLLLERAAPLMQLWHWKGGHIPVDNYISWFVLALFFQGLLRYSRTDTRNAMALPLLLLQAAMYICVILFFR